MTKKEQRKEIKTGKHERIRKLLDNMLVTQPKQMFEESAMGEVTKQDFTPSLTQKRG